MNIVINAIVPIVLILILGNILRRKDFVSTTFWQSSDKVTYFILFPALLITKMATADISQVPILKTLGFSFLYFLIISALLVITHKLSRAKKSQFSSMYQGTIRYNSYIIFAIAVAIWGNETVAITAIILGITIPMVNILSIFAFSYENKTFDIKKVIASIIKNPLIIATAVGFIINVFPILLPTILFNTFEILSKPALPMALLSVGAAVKIKLILKKQSDNTARGIWFTSILRLIIVPIVALGLTIIFQFDTNIIKALVLISAVPTATSAYILAVQMKGDSDMMAAIISLQTVLSIFSLLFWLTLLEMFL